MNIREAINRMATAGSEPYCKVCIVDAVDEAARTVDCSPIDESAPLLSVNLQANQVGGDGIVQFPAVGSYVVVSFLSESAAVVVLCEKIDKVVLKIGETTAELVNGQITLNGGSNGGLTIAPKLAEELNKNNMILQAMLSVITSPVPITELGNGSPSALQAALQAAFAGAQVGDFSQIENDKIKH